MIQTEKLERSMARSLSIGQVTFASFMYYEEVGLLDIFIVICWIDIKTFFAAFTRTNRNMQTVLS